MALDMYAPTNMRRIKRSIKPPKTGDIFTFSIRDGEFFLGLVVAANVEGRGAPMLGANLIYIYNTRLQKKGLRPDVIDPNNLLLPPIWTNRKPWTSGIFETIGHREISEADHVDRYCFRTVNPWTGVQYCVDENGAKIECSDACGSWGLVSYRWIDDHVSDALGITRIPEDGTTPS